MARLAEYLVHEDIRAGRLTPVLTEYVHDQAWISAVYPHKRHLSPKVRAFVDFLAENSPRSRHGSLASAMPVRSERISRQWQCHHTCRHRGRHELSNKPLSRHCAKIRTKVEAVLTFRRLAEIIENAVFPRPGKTAFFIETMSGLEAGIGPQHHGFAIRVFLPQPCQCLCQKRCASPCRARTGPDKPYAAPPRRFADRISRRRTR